MGGGEDTTPPTILSVVSNAAGDEITVTFSEDVQDTEMVFNLELYSVEADVYMAPASVVVTGDTAVFTMGVAGMLCDNETVTYDFNYSPEWQDLAGNPVDSVADGSVTNNSTAVRPTVIDMYTNGAGTLLYIRFDTVMTGTGGFEFKVNGDVAGFNVEIDNSDTYAFSPGSPIADTDVITVTYPEDVGMGDCRDFGTNMRALGAFEDYAVRNLIGVAPTASFFADFTSGTAPLEVTFTDESTGTSITDWLWDFGDGSTSTTQNPVHTYTDPGQYTVILTVGNAEGEDDHTEENYINVNPPE